MSDSKPHSRVRKALELGKELAGTDLSEFPRRHLLGETEDGHPVYGNFVTFEEAERPFVEALDDLESLEEQLEVCQRQRDLLQREADSWKATVEEVRERYAQALHQLKLRDDDYEAEWRAYHEALNPASGAGTSSAEGTNEANAAGPRESSPASEPEIDWPSTRIDALDEQSPAKRPT